MKTGIGIVCLIFAFLAAGCSEGTVKPEDSMGPIIEQGKKDQGITGTDIVPKNQMGKAPGAGSTNPDAPKGDKGDAPKLGVTGNR